MLPRIVSAIGAAITADEITAAARVISTRENQTVGIYRVVDQLTGVLVEFHPYKNIAYTTPGGATDYVAMSMPNPIPFRGVSIGVRDEPGGDFILFTFVLASDGTELAREVLDTVVVGGVSHDRYVSAVSATPTRAAWSGGDSIWMFDKDYSVGMSFHHKLTLLIPEDCIYQPLSASPPYPGVDGLSFQWSADWQAGITILNTRRKLWFKKNSDEFITALKTGFAVGSSVSRAELQTGKLPASWEFHIKRDVDVKYHSYLPPNTVGRKTKRTILYTETAFSDIIESDTSANLTQAGVKVTKRTATLSYNITVADVVEVRKVDIIGFLTQTVTRHNFPGGGFRISRTDVYNNWYNRESTSLPFVAPSKIPAPYLFVAWIDYQDRTTRRIGIALNGTVQEGYNTHSTLGTIDNYFAHDRFDPPWPVAYNTVTADLIQPDFIATWHKDAKITYNKDGIGASSELNDSAMYGVTIVEITPVGIPDYGIFADNTLAVVQNSTQIEIYGTAVYKFNWQTGVLTFSNWKPLTDGNGNEVASKVVDLPAGMIWNNSPNNCLITYRGLHWPDVVAALKVRDKALPDATANYDKVLYTLIQAKKGG